MKKVIELNEFEVAALRIILGEVSGSPVTSPRKYCDSVAAKLGGSLDGSNYITNDIRRLYFVNNSIENFQKQFKQKVEFGTLENKDKFKYDGDTYQVIRDALGYKAGLNVDSYNVINLNKVTLVEKLEE